MLSLREIEKRMLMAKKKINYDDVLSYIFLNHYEDGVSEIKWIREEIFSACDILNMEYPKNPGDVIYQYRYRNNKPSGKNRYERISETAPEGLEWIIVGDGKAKYKFKGSRQLKRVIPENLQQ
jgi:hypothetical protein